MSRQSKSIITRITLALALLLSGSCGRKSGPPAPPPDPRVLVIGEIVECSKIPDPARSDYPDCLFSASVQVQGHGANVTVPAKILVMLPAFKARKFDDAVKLKPGDLIKLRALADKDTPKTLRETQRSDTLADFTLPIYYATSVEPALAADVSSAIKTTNDPANQNDKSKPAPSTAHYPWSPKAAAVRKLEIEEDIARIREGIARHGGSFEAWQRELKPMVDDLNKQTRRAPDRALKQETFYFEHLRDTDYARIVAQADKNEGAFPMLVSMSKQLRARGVDLIVIPYPQKEEVNADIFTKLAPDDGVLEPWRLNFILHLLEADVEVLDVIPSLRAAREKTPDLFYASHDGHPADGGLRATAGAIAARLERYDLLKRPGFVPKKFSSTRVGFSTNHHEKDEPEREYEATQITWADGSLIRDSADLHTPVIILGDSFTVVPKPYGARNSSIRYQLAPYLGELPDSLSSMGGSAQFLKILAHEDASFYQGRCAAVFMFSPNALLNESKDDDAQWILLDLPQPPVK